MPSTVFFDVNETLSDFSPLADAFAGIGAPPALATTWFAATLRDGFALSLTTGAAPFQDVARSVLRGLLATQQNLTCSVEDGVEQVMENFAGLPVHPDVVPGITALADAGNRLVTLTNGSTSSTRALLQRAGILDSFAAHLSVEDAGAWKPDRRAYDYALDAMGVAADAAVLVAVHPWDLHGARQAGLATAFLDRTGAPWPAPFAEPDIRIGALAELGPQIRR